MHTELLVFVYGRITKTFSGCQNWIKLWQQSRNLLRGNLLSSGMFEEHSISKLVSKCNFNWTYVLRQLFVWWLVFITQKCPPIAKDFRDWPMRKKIDIVGECNLQVIVKNSRVGSSIFNKNIWKNAIFSFETFIIIFDEDSKKYYFFKLTQFLWWFQAFANPEHLPIFKVRIFFTNQSAMTLAED